MVGFHTSKKEGMSRWESENGNPGSVTEHEASALVSSLM